MFNFTNFSLNETTILNLERQFKSLALFSNAAEQAYLQSAALLSREEAKERREEIAISFLCQLRYRFLMELLKNPHYFDLRTLDHALQKTTFRGQSIQDCQQFTTEPAKRKSALIFKEQDVYSLAAHINPPTKLKPSIQTFLTDCGIQCNDYKLQDLNIQLVEKLKAIKIGKRAICHKEWGHLNSQIEVDKMAPHVIDCIIAVINENFGQRNLKSKRQEWINIFTTQTTGTLKTFSKLRDNAKGQNTFNVLCILHASLSAYMQAPLTQAQDGGEKYILDTQLMRNILDTISFSASIARELELYEGDYTRIEELVKTTIIAKVNQPNISAILPVCTPIPPDGTCSEHAFYIMLKKVSDKQYKISIINCGYASKYKGVVDFKETLDTQKTIDYLSDAFNVEFFQLADDEMLDGDQLIDKHLEGNIYDEKTYGELVVSNSAVNQQFYGNCTLHNYNFAIKHCFELDTLNFSKFRQMNLVGFDKFIENNKLLSKANAVPSTQTITATTATAISTTVTTSIAKEKSDKESLLRQAALDGNETVLHSLLSEKVDVNCKDELSKKTALHFAAGNNHLGCVRILLAAGAVQTLDSAEKRPLYYTDNPEIISALGGNVRSSFKTQRHQAKTH